MAKWEKGRGGGIEESAYSEARSQELCSFDFNTSDIT